MNSPPMPASTARSPRAARIPAGVMAVSDDRLNVIWDETEGPAVENVGEAGFGTKLLKSALRPFDGKTEISYLKTGVHCTMQCRIPPELSALALSNIRRLRRDLKCEKRKRATACLH